LEKEVENDGLDFKNISSKGNSNFNTYLCTIRNVARVVSASGTSIETVYYVRLTKVALHGVKRLGPVSRFGLKLD
jgi:hypothetical protein